ncbi:MAG: hypothetical protein R2839_05895 [Thermomicrobiales bacterium]
MTSGTARPVLHLPDIVPAVLYGTAALDKEALQTILMERIALGAGWLSRAVGPDGWMTYYYQPSRDRVLMDDYSEVRHAGTTYAMFQAYEVLQDPELLEAAERAVTWIEAASLLTPYGGKAFCLKNRCLLGGQALALVALLERRRVLQDTSFDDLIADLAVFLDVLELRDSPGQHYEIYRALRDRFTVSEDSKYSPGEVMLAQVRLAQHFPDGPFVDAACRVADFLIYRRDGDLPAAGVAARTDHWMAMALSELYPLTGHPHHALAAQMIGDLIREGQYQPQETSWRLIGAARRGTSANYTATATRGEALMAIWHLANFLGDQDAIARFSQSALRNAQFLMRVQYTPELAERFRNPARVVGGWAQDESVADIRMDYVQHNVSALIGAWHLLAEGRLPAGRNEIQPGVEIAIRIPILKREIFTGPGIYSIAPAVAVTIDTRALPPVSVPSRQAIRTRAIEMMAAASDTAWPIDELATGSEPQHLGEALVIALHDVLVSAGWAVGNFASWQGKNGEYELFCEFEDENAAEVAVDVAVSLIEDLINDRNRSLTQAVKHGGTLFRTRYPQNGGITERLIIEARRRGIRYYQRSDRQGFIEFGTGRFQKQMRKAVTCESKALSHKIARNKHLAAQIMRQAGLPAPLNRHVRTEEAAVRAAEQIGYPVVLKPLDGAQSSGVFPGIQSSDEVRRLFPISKQRSQRGDVIVEKYLEGESFRIFLVGEQVVGALERRRAEVTGDGIHTISELIERENASEERQPRPDNYLEQIDINEQTLIAIARQGLELSSIPEAGRQIRLKLIPSGSNGGTRIDRLADMHPDNIEICRQATATVGLAVTGIDLIAPDISKSIWETGGGIVEINGAPAYYPHYRVSSGRSFDPVVPVMEMLFPPGERSQINAIGIAGVDKAGVLARLIESLIVEPGRLVGVALPDQVTLAGMRISRLDTDGPTPIQTVVRNGLMDTAILVPELSDLASPGLEIDQFDVAIVGSGSVEHDPEQSAVVTTLMRMAERHGTVVADANDEPMLQMLRSHSGPILLTSASGPSPHISQQIDQGGSGRRNVERRPDRGVHQCRRHGRCVFGAAGRSARC